MSSLPGSLNPSSPALSRLGGDYFSFLARQFPTLCRHDEFMFFPRATAPREDWWQAAPLEVSALQAAAARVAAWEADLAALLPEIEDTAAGAEAVLLRQSLQSVLRELGPGGPWERDPFFYLKVAALAWAPILAGNPHLNRGMRKN